MDRHWLLSLRIAGRIYRYTTDPDGFEIEDSRSGTVYVFEPGLIDPSPTVSAEATDSIEIPMSVLLTEEAWEALAGLQNHGGLTAELALWTEGQDWSERQIWGDGRVDRPQYETVGEPLVFSLVEVPWEDRSQIPSPSQQVSAATWPVNAGTVCPEDALGRYYPYVFGSPGVLRAEDSATQFLGWPAVLVEVDAITNDNFSGTADAVVILAGHRVVGSSFLLYNMTTKQPPATVSVAVSDDLAGQEVTIATVAGATLQITSGDELWASCIDAGNGGLVAPDGSVVRGAGQIARWLIERSTCRFDLHKLPMLSRIDAFKADFFINEPASAWGIINDTLMAGCLGLLPAYWRRSGAGMYLAVKPWEVAAVAGLPPSVTIDPDVTGGDREGAIVVSSSADMRTDIVVAYAKDPQGGAFLRGLAYAPVPTVGAVVNPYLSACYATLRRRAVETLELPAVQDPATARLFADLEARIRAQTWRAGRYLQPPDPRLQVGGIAILTDSEVRIAGMRAWIVAVTVPGEGDFVTVDLAELPDWLRVTGGA
tara:strand:- start:310 stop:1929 length:1620 start_codon:yes stop_codon:yes gene_type:complete